MGVRHQIWDLLEVTHDLETRSPVVDWYDESLAILIVLNVLAVIVESVEAIQLAYARFFLAFEVFSVAIFTIEYLLRLWACTVDSCYSRPLLGRLKYALNPMVIIDFMSFAPFYIATLPLDLRFLRILRLLRLLRVLKLGRSVPISVVVRA
jgi:voltage-gated potassium channel